jgi:hypothetical protein
MVIAACRSNWIALDLAMEALDRFKDGLAKTLL